MSRAAAAAYDRAGFHPSSEVVRRSHCVLSLFSQETYLVFFLSLSLSLEDQEAETVYYINVELFLNSSYPKPNLLKLSKKKKKILDLLKTIKENIINFGDITIFPLRVVAIIFLIKISRHTHKKK